MPGFVAELRLLTPEEGGRRALLFSGYRSIVRFGAADAEPSWGVEVTFGAREAIAPGETAVVDFRTWAEMPEAAAGTPIYLYEGAQLVGTGSVR